MTPWIVDASLALTWYLDDEVNRAYGLSVLEALSERELRVPALFVYEMSNALVMAYRRNRISREELTEILAKLASFNFAVEDTTPDLFSMLAALALEHGLTCYDAAYLELAMRTALPIATLDKALLAAMETEGVDLVSP